MSEHLVIHRNAKRDVLGVDVIPAEHDETDHDRGTHRDGGFGARRRRGDGEAHRRGREGLHHDRRREPRELLSQEKHLFLTFFKPRVQARHRVHHGAETQREKSPGRRFGENFPKKVRRDVVRPTRVRGRRLFFPR